MAEKQHRIFDLVQKILNQTLTLNDVWLVEINVRLAANLKRVLHSKRDKCQVSSKQCYANRIQCQVTGAIRLDPSRVQT